MPEEPKQLTNAKINISGIGTNSTRALLNSTENLSVAMTKINTYLNDLKSGAFTEAYSHPTYTSRQAGLYKITVDTTGHVFNAIAVTGDDLPSHTHDQYIPLTGSDNITGNLKINNKGRGFFLKDKDDILYPGILDNSVNLWIGASATSNRHHVGGTFISSGYDSANGTGYSTINVSVPNATNDDATNYKVLHNGNTSFTQTVKPSDTGAYKIGTIKINDIDTDVYGKDNNTDTKVNVIARGTTKAYLLGTTTSPTSSNQAVTSVAETGVYFNTIAGELHATTFEGDLSGNVDHTNTEPEEGKDAGYGLTFHTTAGTTGNKALRTNGAVRVMLSNNATTGGYARLTLGNNTASTSGGKNGIIQLYGESANRFCTLTCTGTKNLILDNDSGTGGTNFSPATTDLYDLGTSSLKWRNVYTNNVYGAFNGALTGDVNHTLTEPTYSTTYGLTFHDGEGSTGAKALLTNDAIRLSILHNATAGGYTTLMVGNDTAAASGGKYGSLRLYNTGTAYAELNGNSDGNVLIFKTSTVADGDAFRPGTDNKYDLGTSSYAWRNVYATTLNGNTLNLYDGTKYSYFVAGARSTSSSEPAHVLFGSDIDGASFVPYGAQTHNLGLIDKKWNAVYATTFYGNLDSSNLLGAVSVDKGGTGATTLTSNAIIAGNGTSAVKTIATASGALYATAANGAAKFGTLPVAQGGTGATSASSARTNLGLGTAAIKDSTTSVTSGSTGLVTSGGVYTAIELDTSVSLTSSVGTVSKQAYYSAATKICTFVLQLKLTSALSASSSTTTIATIGKHPKYVCPVVAIDGSNNGLVARVDNSGNIQLCKNTAIASGSTIRVSGSFPVA